MPDSSPSNNPNRIKIQGRYTTSGTSGITNPADLFVTVSLDNSYAPLLTVSEGFVVQKDIQAGGIIGSGQGVLYLGHGLVWQCDRPRITLSRSGFPILQNDDGSQIASGTQFPASPVHRQIFKRTDLNTLHIYETGKGWTSMGPTSDYSGNYDTLYITKADINVIKKFYDPAHLDAGNVTAHGNLHADGPISSSNGHYISHIAMVFDKPNDASSFWWRKYTGNTNSYIDIMQLTNAGNLILYGNLQGINGVVNIAHDTVLQSGHLVLNGSGSYLNFMNGSTLAGALGFTNYNNLPSTVLTSYTGYLVLTANANDMVLYTPNGKVRVWAGATLAPQTHTTGKLGESNCAWGYAYIWNLYVKNPYSLDAYDDLALVKQWGESNPQLPPDYDSFKKQPPKNDIFRMLRGSIDQPDGDDDTEYFNVAKLTSFALGCSKALTVKAEEQQSIIEALLSRIENLEEKLSRSTD